MLSALLITLREGLEAALIIGIILAYLSTTSNRQGFKPVWIGTSLAVLVSLVAGAVIYFSVGRLEGRAEKIFEGIAMWTAASVLTWMIFWMRKQAINIKDHLHAQIQSALGSGSALGLLGLAFFIVVREGIETVLFVFAATRVAESAVLSAVGGIMGLGIAVVIGYSIYKGTSKLNLRAFFNVTGLLLILFAAGLLAHGVHEFHEAGIIPAVIADANPSLVEVLAYVGYLGFVLVSYFRPVRSKKGGEPIVKSKQYVGAEVS
jgi:high-affinity iron transporter